MWNTFTNMLSIGFMFRKAALAKCSADVNISFCFFLILGGYMGSQDEQLVLPQLVEIAISLSLAS